MPSFGVNEESIAQPLQGDVFVAKRTLNIQVQYEDNDQRETIFHLRCTENKKVYNVIIDGAGVLMLPAPY